MAALWCTLALVSVLICTVYCNKEEREAPGEGYEFVTCGSSIKLQHQASNYRLHSHEVAYGSGSQQQSVTLVQSADDPNSLWNIVGDLDKGCSRGSKIENGKVIRLQHVNTKKWLHSHNFPSPLSGNKEVSCFGGPEESNTGDHWRVEVVSGQFWEREKPVRLVHVDTGVFLHSTGQHQYNQPISGQREVCGSTKASSPLHAWRSMEGFYVKTQAASKA